MYDLLLSIHNLVRWFFLAAALYAIFKAVMGISSQGTFTKSDKTAGALLVADAHTMLL
ncbi:MAG: hypothetical protein MH472_00115 [Bacteroidia bacterium]|nr:hypothetical protein [Bacteroidia bacterium]